MRLAERHSPLAGLAGAWALLPLGSCEAHGPHLPLDTDVRISEEMALRAARRLTNRGIPAVVLPTVPYGVTTSAGPFPGTLTIPESVVTALITEILVSAAAQGAVGLVLVNSHFEPAHIDALFKAADAARARTGLPVVYPNLASRRYAARLGPEFESGACHAGSFETSLVLAVRPDLVSDARSGLPEVAIDLAAALRAGAKDFKEMGATEGYFGQPHAGSAEEGDTLFEEMALILEEAVLSGVSGARTTNAGV
ncbi:MAG: creatininase family protein [Pseudomonadota bacterium]|nr:creatininase family protein [Pseudomonadota bacterium]